MSEARSNRLIRSILIALFILAVAYLLERWQPQSGPPPQPGETRNDPLALGNPSGATPSEADPNNYLVERPQFTLSYNRDRGGPNWVSWHLQPSDLGEVEREDSFMPDPLLPADWQIRPSDYQGSGYDRGHMCPSGDRTSSRGDNEATFVMSNMLPQTGELNREAWRLMEEQCRELVRQGNELYIVCGGDGSRGSIARRKVTVPRRCWKVVLVLPLGDDDLRRIDTETRVIAVSIPNTKGVDDELWERHVTTVDAIEKDTGYDFLSNVPAGIQEVLEARPDRAGASVSDARRG